MILYRVAMTMPPYGGHASGPYGAPQPQRSRPWLWGIVGAVIGSVATAMIGFAGLIAIGLWSETEQGREWLEETESAEEPEYYTPELLDAVIPFCLDMHDAARTLSRFSGPEEGRASVLAVSTAVDSVVAAVDRVQDVDELTLYWRDNMIEFRDRLDAYAASLAAGNVEPPDLGGEDGLLEELEYDSPVGCEPPLVVASLDPEFISIFSP